MQEIKFKCSNCGQHIQCGPEHAGENVPCPACATLVRVPADAWLADLPPAEAPNEDSPPLEEEKASYASPFGEGATSGKNCSSTEPVPAPGPAENKSTATSPTEMHCTCPVCQSQLTISLAAETSAQETTRSTERAAKAAGGPKAKAAAPTEPQHLTSSEREDKIAAAREAHPVSLFPPMKPRLDKILDDSEHREAA